MKLMLAAIIIFTFTVILCGSAFADGPWKGKILDIETKEPLKGVAVLAVWDRIYRTPFGTSSYIYEAKETVTDNAGEFEIPSYTPINLLPLLSYIQGPEFTIFKPGYGSLRMSLGDYLVSNSEKIKEMELSGKKYRLAPGAVELPRLDTKDERLLTVRELPPSIPDDEMQYLLKLMNQERIELGLKPIHLKGGLK